MHTDLKHRKGFTPFEKRRPVASEAVPPAGRSQTGFITIAAVMVLLAVAAAAAVSAFLTAWQTGDGQAAWQAHSHARHLAESCAESARALLWEDSSYNGDETLELVQGDCILKPIIVSSGSYAVSAEAEVSSSVARLVVAYELSVDASGSVQALEQTDFRFVADFD